jgi:hypothetical protein
MVLLETPTGADVSVLALVIMGVILALGALGWWLGVSGGKGTGER